MKSVKPPMLLFVTLFFVAFGSTAADIESGKNKAKLCQNCHGTNGNSKNPQYPNLAGQRSSYIKSQLNKFISNQRSNSIMQGIAANLSAEDIENISAYFSSLPGKSAGGDPVLAKKGKNKVAMCKGCHGNSVQGLGETPKLAGQHPEYLKKQLLNFKNNSRKGGPMNSIASSLSAEDIREISAYLGSL